MTDHSIPQELVSLHLWETFALPHMRQITGWGWMEDHWSTLYGRIMQRLHRFLLTLVNPSGGITMGT